MSGHLIMCRACGGTGKSERATAIDCSNCAGRGTNWQRDDGAVAVYQGGPFVGGVWTPIRTTVPT